MKPILILLILVLVTACGSPPLAQPEDDILVETVKLTATPTVEPSLTPLSTTTKAPTPRVYFTTPIVGPTYTPTPVLAPTATPLPVIEVVDRQQLLLDQLRPFSAMADEDVSTASLFRPAGWTEQGEVVFQDINTIQSDDPFDVSVDHEIVGTWAVSPKNGDVRPLSNWTPPGPVIIIARETGPLLLWVEVFQGFDDKVTFTDWTVMISGWTPIQQQMAETWSAKKFTESNKSQYWMPASDGETVILRIRKGKLYILKPDQEPIILPQDAGDIKTYVDGGFPQLSADGKRIAYGVRFDNPDSNDGYGRETDTYEIQISNLDGTSTTVIQLPYEYSYPFRISWFPNSKFIVFTAQPEKYVPSHLYIAKIDGSAIIDITPDGFSAGGPFYWAKNGQKLLYRSGNPDEPSNNGYWIVSFSE